MAIRLKLISLRVPDDILKAMHELAEANGRSINGEALSAFMRHLKSPPEIFEVAGPLPKHDLQPPFPRAKRGGRPFSGGTVPKPRKKPKPATKAEGQ